MKKDIANPQKHRFSELIAWWLALPDRQRTRDLRQLSWYTWEIAGNAHRAWREAACR